LASGVIVVWHPFRFTATVGLAYIEYERYFQRMALTHLAVAEEALSLSPMERAELAKLLIQSLEGDGRTDEEIKADLNHRLENLVSGKDSGLSFDQVFGASL
jgi:putative addiction module component (TIGR02574 family)